MDLISELIIDSIIVLAFIIMNSVLLFKIIQKIKSINQATKDKESPHSESNLNNRTLTRMKA